MVTVEVEQLLRGQRLLQDLVLVELEEMVQLLLLTQHQQQELVVAVEEEEMVMVELEEQEIQLQLEETFLMELTQQLP